MHEIEHIVHHLPVSDKVKADILAVYGLIAEAESHAHGVPVTEIHFHEVGTMDAVADVTAVCLLMEKIGPGQVIASPVHVGRRDQRGIVYADRGRFTETFCDTVWQYAGDEDDGHRLRYG